MTRLTRCRYLGHFDDPCTAEAVDPDGEVLLCTVHLADAIRMVTRRRAALEAIATPQGLLDVIGGAR